MSKALKSITIKHVSDLWLLTEVHYNQSGKKALQIKIKKVTWQTAGQKPSLRFTASILRGTCKDLLETDNLFLFFFYFVHKSLEGNNPQQPDEDKM